MHVNHTYAGTEAIGAHEQDLERGETQLRGRRRLVQELRSELGEWYGQGWQRRA